MRIDSGSEKPRVDINLTPMIDVIFLLIIFFMLAAKFAEMERDLQVNPPRSGYAKPLTARARELTVNVTAEGRLVVEGGTVSLSQLESMIARAVKENPEQAVVIRGDARTALQAPVDVLSLCEKYGIKYKFLTTVKGERSSK